ncbi:Protein STRICTOSIDINE SYNTHASE-LIKE 10, partial [Linum grandiflorum]
TSLYNITHPLLLTCATQSNPATMDTKLLVVFFISLIINFCSILGITTNNLQKLELPAGVVGPESIAFDCEGQGPYVGVSDGRILRDRAACDGKADPSLEPKCGRPLGLKFHPLTCDLYIADAYFGLMATGPDGGLALKLVSSSSDGVPFKFTNALDIDTTSGIVYFTDSSLVYQRSDDVQKIVASQDKTGRLFSYEPHTRNLTLLARLLPFPNGVALSKDNSYLTIAETFTNQILKFPLNLGFPSPQVLTNPLPGFPDNVRRSLKVPDDGVDHFWVGLNSGRSIGLNVTGNVTGDPVAVKLNEHGEILETVDGGGGEELDSVSEVLEDEYGSLWFGSVTKSYLGFIGTKEMAKGL